MCRNAISFFGIMLLMAHFGACNVVAQPTFAHHSKCANGTWYKIPISETGIYKLTTSDIAALNGTPCNHIALYGAPGGMLSSNNMDEHIDDMVPTAIEVVDANKNGVFEADDYILFYGEGANIWRYVSNDQRFEYAVHAYANNNYYYLTVSEEMAETASLRIQSTNLEANQPDLTSHTAVALYHPDNINTHGSGQIWVADKFSVGLTQHTYNLSLPGIKSGDEILARYAFASISTTSTKFEMRLGSSSHQHVLYNGTLYQTYRVSFTVQNNNTANITCTFTPYESNAAGYMDYIELNGNVAISYTGGQTFIRNKQRLGVGHSSRFRVQGDGNNVSVWDVTNPSQPSKTAPQVENNKFSFVGLTDVPRTFLAFSPNDVLHPTGIVPLPNHDIHGAEVPDYVIVTHKDFVRQAEQLAELHRQHNGLNVLVVTQEEVFDEFSSGRQDPIAIRQMMRCLRAKSDDGINPRYLLLFGKGTYDNRDILGLHQRSVVTYQTPGSFDSEGSSYPSDDIFGYIDNNIANEFAGSLSVGIGRLPASTPEQADHLVDKIAGYLTRRDLSHEDIRGDWRNYVALLADDADPSCSGDTNFASDSEITAKLIKQTYPQFNLDRIYADSYIQQSGADGSYYPDVNNALKQRMDYGCILLNYIGHGSNGYIGTERYMQLTDIEKYANTDRLPFFVTSTCSFGKYDMTDDVCGSEAFVLADAAGIGVVAAARPIHHVQSFNTSLCLFALDPANSVGDALRMAKNKVNMPHCITLIGDPAIHLDLPKNEIVVTKINDHLVQPDVTDSAEVLSRVTVEGEIRDNDGNILTDFNGEIFPIVFDREVACHTLANDNDSTEVNFVQQKSILYKGHSTVEGGKFTYSFIIPRDVSYSYDFAKLSHYARSSNDDATGQYDNIMFGGFDEDVVIGELHPDVELFIGDTNFRNGGLTNETPCIYARLTDSVGINAAGSGLGHDITATIDGNPYSTVTLNDFFEPDIADSRNGEIRYTLGKLDEGIHTLTLKCWNIFNYSGSATIEFRVANDRKVEIGQFAAAPNPAHDRTTIRIEHNQTSAISSIRIDIFDMRGQRVKTLEPSVPNDACVIACPWDFCASNGTQLPRGIYVARVTLTTTDGMQHSQITKVVRN